jgi:hypothetical protein
MPVPKLAWLKPIKLALKSSLTKFNVGRCLADEETGIRMIGLRPVCHRFCPSTASEAANILMQGCSGYVPSVTAFESAALGK